MKAARRFWVEVTPRFATPPCPPTASSSSASGAGSVPRLTEVAAAVGLAGTELDAELASARKQRSQLAAYELGLIERKATLGSVHVLPLLPSRRVLICVDHSAPPPAGALPNGSGASGQPGVGGGPEPSAYAPNDFLPEEVAVLLNCSVPSARHLVEYAVVLVRQLPAVWHALADGRIDESRARVIYAQLRWQATSFGGPIDDDIIAALAAQGVAWVEAGCPPTTVKERLAAALIAIDPEAADRRRKVRERDANVGVQGTGDGLADLVISGLDSATAKLAHAQIDAYARQMKADGDERSIGALRIAVVVALITRPWDAPDPAVAHVTINAHLADLIARTTTIDDLHHLLDTLTTTHDDDDDDEDDENDENEGTVDGEADQPDETEDDGADVAADDADRDATAGHATATATAGHGTGTGTATATATDNRTPTTGNRTGARRGNRRRTMRELGGGELGGDGLGGDGPGGDGAGARRRRGGRGVGDISGEPVSPSAVRALLEQIDALGLTHPIDGHLADTITGHQGRLLAVATPEELLTAATNGRGLGPPPPTPGYTPTAAQYRYLRSRDQHCRFPGCRRTARDCDADHARPYDKKRPTTGGPTCVTNLVLLCRRHHRLKTHAPGWRFTLDPDGTLHVTTPGGTTRTTRPPATDQIYDPTADPTGDPTDDPDGEPPSPPASAHHVNAGAARGTSGPG